MTEKRTFPVWKTLTLGQYPDYQTYKTCIAQTGGMRIDDTAEEILMKMRCAKEKTEVDVVRVYAGREGYSGDLGFRQGTSRRVFFERALELGLQLCPIEVAPALRLAHQVRELEAILIAMEPVIVGKPPMACVVTLYNDAGPSLWLNNSPVDRPQYADWTLRTPWVFVQPRRNS